MKRYNELLNEAGEAKKLKIQKSYTNTFPSEVDELNFVRSSIIDAINQGQKTITFDLAGLEFQNFRNNSYLTQNILMKNYLTMIEKNITEKIHELARNGVTNNLMSVDFEIKSDLLPDYRKKIMAELIADGWNVQHLHLGINDDDYDEWLCEKICHRCNNASVLKFRITRDIIKS